MTHQSMAPPGYFSGYASIFHTPDDHHDAVMPGAFGPSITAWQSNGTPFPILWQHNVARPIGHIHTMREDKRGLHITGQLCLDTQQGREARSLMKQGSLTGLSIGFRVVKSTPRSAKGKQGRWLITLDLMEISLVTFPSHRDARIIHII